MPAEPRLPPMDESTLLRAELDAPDGEFTGVARWNEAAYVRFREKVGNEVASNLLRSFGADLVQSIEDVLAGQTHPPGPCLPGCRYHVNTPADSIPSGRLAGSPVEINR
jgi:hypothetical protein